MTPSSRRSMRGEAIAPWAALAVILMLWWAGAKAVEWARPHFADPSLSVSGSAPATHLPTARAVDKTVKEPALTSAHNEPTLTADVSVTGIDLANLRRRELEIPVKGLSASELVSSFNDARGGHKHEATDILAPRGTEVVAVEGGTIAKLFTSQSGGLTIYQFDPSQQYVYYYAHLDSYAPNLKETDEVRRGQVIGYVGTTGNAPKNTPHLHFAIAKLGPDRHWWEGTPLDPFLVWRDPPSN